MNVETIIEIVSAVYSIQEDICDLIGWDEGYSVSVSTDGFICNVFFLGMCVWCSEDDDRNFDESIDKYEPFEPYLRRILNEELSKLKMIVV